MTEGGRRPGDDGGSGDASGSTGLDSGTNRGMCSGAGGHCVVSCLEPGGILQQCIQDQTTLAACMTEAQNCANNGGTWKATP